jgi:hypothetical protein
MYDCLTHTRCFHHGVGVGKESHCILLNRACHSLILEALAVWKRRVAQNATQCYITSPPLSPPPPSIIILRIPNPAKVRPKALIRRIPRPPIQTRSLCIKAAILFPRHLLTNDAMARPNHPAYYRKRADCLLPARLRWEEGFFCREEDGGLDVCAFEAEGCAG